MSFKSWIQSNLEASASLAQQIQYLSGSNYTGTSSYATTSSYALTASYAPTASYINTLNQDINISGSVYITGSVLSLTAFNRVTASYTISLSDVSRLIETSASIANTITIPSSSITNFDIGSNIDIVQYGTGQTSITSGSTDVIIRSTNNWLKINAQYGAVSLIKIASDEWYLIGNLNA